MSKVVIFGAGGRAGKAAVAEARRRDHQVTAVVRDPAAHGELAADGVMVVAGDVTDTADVAKASVGHDAVIASVADLSASPSEFYTGAVRALGAGLADAGVSRLVFVGLASLLVGQSGVPLMDEPGYPQEYREFLLGHAAGLAALADTGLDWLYISPAGDFDHGGGRTGSYRIAEHGDAESRLTYPDFAIALLDEIDSPAHSRVHLGITA
ncbi:NAD(P)-dependent oxidoreductase [Actinomadura sp. 6N118]|uniref:NAD(P)-dependent oxidoreductase n=1 Tax=Actinomadura sp. 6N118 TaxID=3375151 RepID=UPI00378FCD5F